MSWVSIGSGNGLAPVGRQAITWNNAALLLIGPLGTNFSEILIIIRNVSFTKMHLKTSSAKWRPLRPEGDDFICQHMCVSRELTHWSRIEIFYIFQTTFSKSLSCVNIVVFWHFSDDIFKVIFLFEYYCIFVQNLPNCVLILGHLLERWICFNPSMDK